MQKVIGNIGKRARKGHKYVYIYCFTFIKRHKFDDG